MSKIHRRIALTIALSLSIGIAGCGGSADKAGGVKPERPTVLRLLNPREGADVQPFADSVSRLSKGALQLDVGGDWEKTSTTAEVDAIRAIRAGQADLAVIPARAWHSVGVTSFDALVAPLTVDSMALQQRVLAGDLPGQMLTGLKPLGLQGIGILPGVMRKPAGITRPLLEPSDYRGATIAVSASAVTEQALRALGAVPVASVFRGAGVSEFDGIEQQVSSIADNQYDDAVRTVTGNVNLWARPLVIVASAATIRRISERQLNWLRSGVQDALGATTRLLMAADAQSLAAMCRRGKAEFVTATTAQLARLQAAFDPVYVWLRQDRQTGQFLDQIAAIRAGGVRPYPEESLSCRPGGEAAAAASARTRLDGTYRMVTTEAEGRQSDPNVPPENWGTWIFVFDRGHFAFTQQNAAACTWGYGTYTLDGKQTTWDFADGGGEAPNGAVNKPGEHFVFGWSAYRDTVKLSAIDGAISPDNFYLQPWHRLSSKPSTSSLNKKCPPPAQALPK